MPEQIQRFMVAMQGDRLQAMWCLVLATGLRRAELAASRWRDATLDRNPPTLAVRSTRTTAGHAVVEYNPKSRASWRVLHLDNGRADVLQEHRAAMAGEAAGALFQVVTRRYLKGSIYLTANLGIAGGRSSTTIR